MKIEIKNCFDDSVLFAHEAEENTLKITLLMALKAKKNMYGANLRSADLYGANLRSADLRSADLRGADLRRADLGGANLRSANLRSANLRSADLGSADLGGANLRSADLGGADLGGKKLIGNRPFIQIGPIGSRCDYLQAFITHAGIMIRAGCFFGSYEEFESKVRESHGSNEHGKEYMAALLLIDAHAEIWAPKK